MPAVLLALEEFSASTLTRALRGDVSGYDPEIAAYEAFLDRLGRLGKSEILVTHKNLLHFARYLEERPGELRLIYLRPGIVILKDLFGAIAGSHDASLQFRVKLLDYLDAVFSSQPTISLEELHHRPAKAAETLSGLLGARIDPQSLAGSGGDEYRWITQRMLQSFAPSRAAQQEFPGFALGVAYPITGAGRLALNTGWSYPEDSFIWSDGPSASLLLPFPAAARGVPLRCRLVGFVAGGPVRVTTSIGTLVLDERIFTPSEPRDLIIDMPIPQALDAGSGLLRLDLAFENTVCPKELGLSEDSRRLGCGLRSIMLYGGAPGGDEAVPSAPAEDLDLLAGHRGIRLNPATAAEAGSSMLPSALVPVLERLVARWHGGTVLAAVGDHAGAIPVLLQLRSQLGFGGTLLICCGDATLAAMAETSVAEAAVTEEGAAGGGSVPPTILLLAETPDRVLESLAERNHPVELAVAWSPGQFDAISAALHTVAGGRYAKKVNLLLLTQAAQLSWDGKHFIEEHGAIVELAGHAMLATARFG